MRKLSIIIPVYNEEKTIINILEKIRRVKFSVKREIIIIDDGSRDSSKEIIENYIKKNKRKKDFIFISKKNGGKGSAIRLGFEKAKGDLIIAQDADLEYAPEEIKILIKELEKKNADVIYGSRMLKSNPTSHWAYYAGNWFLSLITSVFYGCRITDMETCYKLMPSKIIKELNLKSNKFDIEPEVTAKILKKGYKIREVPITYSPRSKEEGKKLGWVDGIGALWQLIKWKFKKI